MRFFIFMSSLNILKGQKFGNLLVISDGMPIKHPFKLRRLRMCLCDCGRIIWRSQKWIFRIKDLSCGMCKDKENKVCPSCKKIKPVTDFHKNGKFIQSNCKECKADDYKKNKQRVKDRYHKDMNNPEKKIHIYARHKKSRLKNRDKEKKQKLSYNARPEVIARRKEIHRIRKETDLQYNIKRRLRWRVRDIVKKQLKDKNYKYKSAIDLLGCDVEFLKTHLESTFTQGMSWDRISEMHIDHIKPCNMFDLTKLEEQKMCFHYTNLQMLWWQDNLTKGKNEIR